MKTNSARRRKKELIVYVLAAVLMFVRVDFWWWGKEMPLYGWFTLPMLYQFGIWLAGWVLVMYTANRIWSDDDAGGPAR